MFIPEEIQNIIYDYLHQLDVSKLNKEFHNRIRFIIGDYWCSFQKCYLSEFFIRTSTNHTFIVRLNEYMPRDLNRRIITLSERRIREYINKN